MTSQGFVVWAGTALRESLSRRFPQVPLRFILRRVWEDLSQHPETGRKPPFPYNPQPNILMKVFEIASEQGTFRVVPIYEIDESDCAVEVFDVGIVRLQDP